MSKVSIMNIKYEKENYFPNSKEYLIAFLLRQNRYFIWKYQKLTRKIEAISRSNVILYSFYNFRKNILGYRLGIELPNGVFDEGLVIHHSYGIVVNKDAKVGRNCHLHGGNCIGNDGFKQGAPKIGDNCNIGIGAKVIGNVTLGNDIVIAAGAVVVKSCYEDGVTLAGVPAKIVRKRNEKESK